MSHLFKKLQIAFRFGVKLCREQEEGECADIYFDRAVQVINRLYPQKQINVMELTKETLKKIENRTDFASGICFDSPESINMTNSGESLRWVAVKGGIEDWCIYVHWSYHSLDYIIKSGDKVTWESNIRKLVPCSDEVFALYRF